ncbi:D-amino acid dehydrogenase [Achromobacter agilis]|uniref:D-amino acid dehydrogenase n=1 Tax=Achromobacter agilis TaxID=1353888 RepID=A0A446CNR9_9BURK|nr:D-amino acid dehydrogenase [Achromobacter agilis]
MVGVTTAHLLARAGHEVALVDERAGPALGSSFANGGQLSYSYVAPLAGPGTLAEMPRWLFRRDSPLRLRYRCDPAQWRWLAGFLSACRASVARASTAQLLSLSYLSRDTLHAMLDEAPMDFGLTRTGKLIVYRSAALLEKAAALVRYQAAHGAQQRVLSSNEAIAAEPALAGLGGKIAGAVFTPGEEAGDCHRFTDALFQRLQRASNVAVHMNTRVQRLRRERGRIVAAQTSEGDLQADAFVVASGIGSRPLLAALGQRVPLYPLKGYSLSVPLAADSAGVPAISVTDYERRIVYARLGDVLRIAAMVDIGAPPEEIDASRMATLRRQVSEAFPRLDLSQAQAWAGVRPATPTSKPLIGRSRAAGNLWLNIGQGALGFTLACGSAALLTAQLSGLRPPIDPAPFQP